MSNLSFYWPFRTRSDSSNADMFFCFLSLYYLILLCERSFLGMFDVGNVPVICTSLLFCLLTFNKLKMGPYFWTIGCAVCVLFFGLLKNTIVDGYGMGAVIGDTSVFLNGPFVLLWIMCCGAGAVGSSILSNIAISSWFLVTCMICVSGMFEIGQNTYEAYNLGWKFFFVSNNELTFCYTLLTGVAVLRSKLIRATVYMIVAGFVLSTIGTKSGYLGMMVLMIVLSLRGMRFLNYKIGVYYLLAVVAFLMLFFLFIDIEGFLKQLIPYFSFSSGFLKLQEKISYFGFWDGLLSGRGRFVSFAISEYMGSSLWDLVFGIGFSDFKLLFESEFGNSSFSEVDVADVTMSFGGFGLVMYLGFVYFLIRRWLISFRQNSPKSEEILFITLVFILVGNTSGHVVFSAWAMATVALLVLLAEEDEAYLDIIND